MAEGLFARANIISFTRFTYLLPANELFGPMQISLARMITVRVVCQKVKHTEKIDYKLNKEHKTVFIVYVLYVYLLCKRLSGDSHAEADALVSDIVMWKIYFKDSKCS